MLGIGARNTTEAWDILRQIEFSDGAGNSLSFDLLVPLQQSEEMFVFVPSR